MYLVKSKEIDELKKDCQMRDAALDGITAAAQATREASDQVIHKFADCVLFLSKTIHVNTSASRYKTSFPFLNSDAS